MNGGHDLGGLHGLGDINPEPEMEEPVFHAEWEKRVFALTLATGMLGKWNIDSSRHARERQHPATYINNTYYENWLAGLQTLLIENGLVSAQELSSGKAYGSVDADILSRVPDPRQIPAILKKGGPSARQPESEPAFGVGVPVRVCNRHPEGHTRAPRYTRGREGVVAAYHGYHVFPDRAAHGPDGGAHLYSVRFTSDQLWGNGRPETDSIFVDLWEPHLEAMALWQR